MTEPQDFTDNRARPPGKGEPGGRGPGRLCLLDPQRVSCCLLQASSPAQQLLQATKGRWSPPPKGAAPRTAAAKAKAAEPAAFPKVPESRRKSLRQFSITTALNTLNRMVHAPAERPALHISSPVLVSSSNPTVATQSSEKAELPCGTPLQVGQPGPSPGSSRGTLNLGLSWGPRLAFGNSSTPGRVLSFLLPTLTKGLSTESSQIWEKKGLFTFL